MPESKAEWWANFGRLLDEQMEWPAPYVFKFIVPVEQMPVFIDLFGGVEIQEDLRRRRRVRVRFCLHATVPAAAPCQADEPRPSAAARPVAVDYPLRTAET